MELRPIARNRRAHHEYHLERAIEAGIALLGSEVKSARQGHISIHEAWVAASSGGQLFLHQARIEPYTYSTHTHHDPVRTRRLLVKKKQAVELWRRTQAEGWTLVVTQVHLNRGRIKIMIALGRGKKAHDKRHALRERQQERETAAALKQRRTDC